MRYVINGSVQQIDEPLERGGTNYIPLAQVAEALGGSTTWDNNSKTATLTLNGRTVQVQMVNETVNVDGRAVTLNAAPFVTESTMYVPWDFFQNALGYRSEVQGDILTINS